MQRVWVGLVQLNVMVFGLSLNLSLQIDHFKNQILFTVFREILEESGIIAKPECITGIYQNLVKKKGYGPLEGMALPTTLQVDRWAGPRTGTG